MTKILFVDDDSLLIKLAGIVFPKLGYELITKENGQEAWDYLTSAEGESIDLLFTDHQMPIMNGLKLTRKIRESNDFNGLPIIMASGGTTNRSEALTMGVNEFIEKPYNVRILPEILNQYLNLD